MDLESSVSKAPRNDQIFRVLCFCHNSINEIVHLVCFISNYLFEQPVNVVQFLMVVASWLLNFKKKFPMVVAYAYVFWEILKN